MTKREDVRANARRRQVSRKVSHDVLVHVRLRDRAERHEDVDFISIARGRCGHAGVLSVEDDENVLGVVPFLSAYFLKCFRYVFSPSNKKRSFFGYFLLAAKKEYHTNTK